MRPPDPEKNPNRKGLCYLPLSAVHIEGVRELQDRILFGGQKCLAWPRGYGKDSLSEAAAIWAAVYGHSRFTVFTCYKIEDAFKRLEEIKLQFEINVYLRADFPEFCYPAIALERAPQRAKLQTYRQEYTRIEWGTDFIVLPTARKSKGGGSIIAAGSLSGSVRGMRINGYRPTFVVISDPQTREVACSVEQVEKTMLNIRADFGGLGGPDETLSMLALATIIRRNDVADQLTNTRLNPQWNGDRRRLIEAWPERMDLWHRYFELRGEGAVSGDTHGRTAHQFYLQHRNEMDAGSKLAWAEAYDSMVLPDGTRLEVSALQHAMNLLWRMGEEAFSAECQNEPQDAAVREGLSVEAIMLRLSMFPHRVAPPKYTTLVRGVDIRGREIHFVVKAFRDDGTSSVIDYDILPIFAPDGDLNNPRSAARPALERAVLDGLRRLRAESEIGVSPYKSDDDRPIELALTLVDARWLTQIVKFFCQESGTRFRPTMGHQAKPGNTKFSIPGAHHQGAIGTGWYAKLDNMRRWEYHLDADHWKLYAQERFMQDLESPGACSLYGNDPKTHKLFAKHMASEIWNPEKNKFEEKSRFNHFLDCEALADCAASMIGIGIIRQRPIDRQLLSLQQWFEKRRKARA